MRGGAAPPCRNPVRRPSTQNRSLPSVVVERFMTKTRHRQPSPSCGIRFTVSDTSSSGETKRRSEASNSEARRAFCFFPRASDRPVFLTCSHGRGWNSPLHESTKNSVCATPYAVERLHAMRLTEMDRLSWEGKNVWRRKESQWFDVQSGANFGIRMLAA